MIKEEIWNNKLKFFFIDKHVNMVGNRISLLNKQYNETKNKITEI